MADALDGLDAVPWSSLRHAYGVAVDTPGLLRRIAQGGVDGDSWEAIFSSIAHQGTVYPASAAAAPFLIGLSRTLRGDDLVGVLQLLECIAAGGAQDAETSRACISAAEVGFDRYVELLADPRDEVATTAAQLVARYPERRALADDAFVAAIDAAGPGRRTAVLDRYLAVAPLSDETTRQRLLSWMMTSDGAAAAVAAFGLIKGTDRAPDTRWIDRIVDELVTPADRLPSIDVRELLRDAPSAARSAMLDALVARAPAAHQRYIAFNIGHALLWLAFHRRLGGPATKPRPFVIVESLAFPMPWDTGGGHPGTVRPMYVREGLEAPEPNPRAEWACMPYVCTWNFPRAGYWKEPPSRGPMPGINIAEPIASSELSATERCVVARLAGLDGFWLTESDLLRVYGLPVRRGALSTMVIARS